MVERIERLLKGLETGFATWAEVAGDFGMAEAEALEDCAQYVLQHASPEELERILEGDVNPLVDMVNAWAKAREGRA